VLGFADTANITGVFNASTGTLTLSGSDTGCELPGGAAAVTYANNSDNPSGLSRTVTFTATDGTDTSSAVTSTINVTR